VVYVEKFDILDIGLCSFTVSAIMLGHYSFVGRMHWNFPPEVYLYHQKVYLIDTNTEEIVSAYYGAPWDLAEREVRMGDDVLV
jgi:hypothetical protein